LGPVESDEGLHYLRPETAQGIFVNFLNVMNSARKKPPFGIAQTGKGFRNEITPGNFIFRTREFEMMELEFFVEPGHGRAVARLLAAAALAVVRRSRDRRGQPALLRAPAGEAVALLDAHSRHRVPLRHRQQGLRRARGHRQPHRLRPQHAHQALRVDLSYFDQDKGERWVPYVIEPAAGLTRATLAFLLDAYAEDEAPNAKGGIDKRVVLRLDPRLAR
jgi:glycyl-tRNA synthetase